ncbi:hypothetical protein GOP47_0022633 [Adiantum capillus-veneris]|uniref:Uncharacterized protein n=1 Tax=Adiantum capillus-veneris TaxID=13818 RepID=A0A9D4Z5I4_ADICA|nr:hypothetical protein GOP47_0022633 [Adiantum capillus-veneris]
MVDYALGVRNLQDQLCRLLDLLAPEVVLISCLKVMRFDDVVYLIHVENLTALMNGSLNRSVQLEFIVLDDTVARFALSSEKDEALNEFASFTTFFLSKVSNVSESTSGHPSSSTCGLIDLGSSELWCEAALPTLNGWILGYPVIYYFKKENVSKAVRTLSVSALLQFKILIQSSVAFQTSEVQGQKGIFAMHSLTSFTMPSELNSERVAEEWASSLQEKVKNSRFWRSLELQVVSQICPTVVL